MNHRITLLAAMGAVAMIITGCSHADEPAEDHPLHSYYAEGGGTSAARPEDAMPYGPTYRDLVNHPPADVAIAALTQLGEATSYEVDSGTAIDRLNGVTTPALWGTITAEPSLVVPDMTGPLWRAWDEAGGTQRAEVFQDGEQHPEDTATTWARKFAVTRTLAGQPIQLHDSYVVECEKVSGQWRISGLQLLSTTATTPTQSPMAIAPENKTD